MLVHAAGEDGKIHFSRADATEKIVSAAGLRLLVDGPAAYILTRDRLRAVDRAAYIELGRLRAKKKRTPQQQRRLEELGSDPRACLKWDVPCSNPYELIMAGDTIFAGGDDRVVAYRAAVQQATSAGAVAGRAYGLAASGGRLLVSTDTGAIYYRRNHWDKWYRGGLAGGKPAVVAGLQYVTGDIAFGSDGLIYPIHWGWVTRRLNRAWKPAPFPAIGTHGIRAPARNSTALDAEGFGDSLGPDTPCLGLDGKLYRFASHPETGYARVHVWGRDGKLERNGVFPFSRIRHGSVIRVDREGCLYVALNGLPEGWKAPAALGHGYYRHFSGTLIKLRLKGHWTKKGAKPDPQAGKVPADAGKRAAGVVLDTWTTTWSGNPRWGYVYSGQRGRPTIRPAKAFVHDVEWAVPGISWISPPGNCTCNGPWFDLDRFGRLYVPDPALSRVRILDAQGNQIAELAGKSGELFIARPIRVAAAGDLFAFWDAANLRVLSANLEYAVTGTCQLEQQEDKR